jgi:hypothetical protein
MEQVTELQDKALAMPDQAKSIVVNNQSSYEAAGAFLKNIKALRFEIQNTFKPIISKAHATWKEAIAQQKQVEEPLIDAENVIKPKIGTYLDEQEAKRREEEARLLKEAKEREEASRLKEAEELEKAGEHEAAEAVISQPVDPTPVVLPKSQKVDGISKRENWLYQVVDANKIPREYLCVDTVKIGQVVRALKSNCRIPGVRVYKETTVASTKQ